MLSLSQGSFFPAFRNRECDWRGAEGHLGEVQNGVPYGWICTKLPPSVGVSQFTDQGKSVRNPCWRQIILFLDDFTFSSIWGLHYRTVPLVQPADVTDLLHSAHRLPGFRLRFLELSAELMPKCGSCCATRVDFLRQPIFVRQNKFDCFNEISFWLRIFMY